MTPDFRPLAAHLRAWDIRRRRQALLVWLPRALALGLLPALAVALLARARPLLARGEIALLAAALAVTAAALATVAVFARRRSLVDQARFADRQFGLRERATAAVEIQEGRLAAPGELAGRQLADTLAAAATVDVPRQMPLTARPADWLPALATLVALGLALWLPNPQEAILLGQRAMAATVAEQAEALEDLSGQIAANESLSPEQAAALQRPLEEAVATLNQPGVSPEEAMAALSGAESELRSLSADFNHDALSEAVGAAADELAGNEASTELASALQAAQAARAAQAAGDLAAALPQLDAAAQQALAESLGAAAEDMAAVDEALADPLARAAAALEAGDSAAAQAALREAADELAQQAQAGEAAAQASAAADQMSGARREVAAAGQTGESAAQAESGGQSANDGQGTGQQGGTGQGQGEQADAGGEGAGGQGQSSATGGPGPGGGHVESVFVPSPVDLSGQGADVELDTQCLTAPETCGPEGQPLPGQPVRPAGGSVVPYDQVFGDYRDAAFEALPASRIPLQLQGLVRDYFSALEPGEN